MCGILAVIGNYRYKNLPSSLLERGRDDYGQYKDKNVQLIQTRLHITGGKVKLPFKHRGLVVLFNGEIFNWKELQKEVGGHHEYEVIIRMFLKYGHSFYKKLDGQYCIFIYSIKKKALVYYIDEFKIHTVYKLSHKGSMIYSSNLRSLPQIKFNEKQSRGFGNITTAKIL